MGGHTTGSPTYQRLPDAGGGASWCCLSSSVSSWNVKDASLLDFLKLGSSGARSG